MSDDKTKRGPPDNKRVNIHEPYELRDWATKWGVTPQRVIDCEKKVGDLATDVKRCLGK